MQSMTNTKTENVDGTVVQIQDLAQAGCQVVRVAIPNREAVKAFSRIRKKTALPLVADVHFDYRIALAAIDAGADKIRINPGNIGGRERLEQVVRKAISYHIPIRIGVNSGSIEKDLLRQEGGPTVTAMVKSLLRHVQLCQEFGAEDLVLSVKSSDVLKTIQAYQIISEKTDLPLHIGITEAGTIRYGTIKSSVGLGILLWQGIGDTLRVSLTGDPVEEVLVGLGILRCLNLASGGITVISCPTCGRTEVDLVAIADEIERRIIKYKKKLTVAIMGCEVNGPGEAREADLGIACGRKSGLLFKKGKILRKVAEDRIADELIEEIERWPDAQ